MMGGLTSTLARVRLKEETRSPFLTSSTNSYSASWSMKRLVGNVSTSPLYASPPDRIYKGSACMDTQFSGKSLCFSGLRFCFQSLTWPIPEAPSAGLASLSRGRNGFVDGVAIRQLCPVHRKVFEDVLAVVPYLNAISLKVSNRDMQMNPMSRLVPLPHLPDNLGQMCRAWARM